MTYPAERLLLEPINMNLALLKLSPILGRTPRRHVLRPCLAADFLVGAADAGVGVCRNRLNQRHAKS